MKNLILKITEGDLFRFFDTEERTEVTIGAKRSADIAVKAAGVLPVQTRLFYKDGAWYAEDCADADAKCRTLIGGKRFRRPVVKFDGDITFRRADEKKGELARISAVRQIERRHSGSGFDLTRKTVTTVGRAEGCDIRVDNPLVSEKHFFIVFDGENCFIEDAHSLGGTYVNNRRVKRRKLADYDRISIPSAAYIYFRQRLLYSTAAGGIRIDAASVSRQVSDRASRGKVSLVTDASFRIEAGEFVAIVGGSGAGKSTLLDCINGMRPATGGKIYYDSNDYYENINTYKAIIGYVPQRDILHDDLTLERALLYTAQLRVRADLSREELSARVKQALADVRLTGKEHLRVSSLSGGQRKRASIAMELLSDPKVIFLDEPTSGLSPDLDMEMMELLKELSKKGRTIVAVTHAMDNLDKCDRVLFLGRGGRVCYFGPASGALRWFNRRSYSRVFAALSDEETSRAFADKYRAGAAYRELYAAFCREYGANAIAPPLERAEPDAWEKPPADLPGSRRRRAARPAGTDEGAQNAPAAPQNGAESSAAETGQPASAPKRAARGKGRRGAGAKTPGRAEKAGKPAEAAAAPAEERKAEDGHETV